MTHDSDARLLAPYRAVRQVTAPGDSPWSGTLVSLPSGDTGILVPSEELPPDWRGWDASPSGHVLAPLDIVRTAGGHSVLIPACIERVEVFLRRRGDAGVPVGAGEVVTIGVSLVRAIAELGGGADDMHGDWWLTDARRPVLVTGCGSQPAMSATAGVARALADAMPDAVWDELIAVAERDRVAERDIVRVEDALFARAAAEPLADAPLGSRRSFAAVDAVTTPQKAREMRARGVGLDGGREIPVEGPPRTWLDLLSRHVDADLSDAVSQVTTGVWRRLRTRPDRGRRAPWLVAASVAAIIVVGGLVWPTGGSESVAADSAPPASPDAADTTVPSPTAEPMLEADTATVAADLLTARTACAGDADCLAAHVRDPGRPLPPGVIDLATEARTVSLVDEFGGVAVLRVDDATGTLPSQLIVVQRDGRRWLLRDVYAAQQP